MRKNNIFNQITRDSKIHTMFISKHAGANFPHLADKNTSRDIYICIIYSDVNKFILYSELNRDWIENTLREKY